MDIRFSDLWRPSGTINRGTYAVVGLVGFAIKHNLDRLLALAFDRPWGIFSYWGPVHDAAHITQLSRDEAKFLAALVAASLPFIWIGVVTTLKRLRDAKLPSQLVILFFLPFLNLLFFLALSLIPSRALDDRQPPRSFLSRLLPESAVGSAAVSLLITVPLGFILAVFGSKMLTSYGWGLFVALPFAVGFTSTVLYGQREERSLGGSIWVACAATGLLGLALLSLAIEGAFCLIMIIPLALPVAILGGVCGHYAVRWPRARHDAPAYLAALLFFVPGLQWMEHAAAKSPVIYEVRTTLDIQAPPEQVWKQVVAFSLIPPPKELLFRAGIAYPIRAEMLGSGPGAERHCVFSTGAFVEPIQIWNKPRQLKFSVTSNPAPMEEWTPYSHIDPPHLHGFLVSEGGQFLLTPLPNGRTRLEGTTWYQHGLWPAAYWRLWSDAIIHKIHLRVLRHIRDEAEGRPNST